MADARLAVSYPQVPPALAGGTASRGLLHQISLDGLCNLRCGFFAGAEAQWWMQDLRDGLSGLPGDDFWQLNFMAGYRSGQIGARIIPSSPV